MQGGRLPKIVGLVAMLGLAIVFRVFDAKFWGVVATVGRIQARARSRHLPAALGANLTLRPHRRTFARNKLIRDKAMNISTKSPTKTT
jgi:hypothetical protein